MDFFAATASARYRLFDLDKSSLEAVLSIRFQRPCRPSAPAGKWHSGQVSLRARMAQPAESSAVMASRWKQSSATSRQHPAAVAAPSRELISPRLPSTPAEPS